MKIVKREINEEVVIEKGDLIEMIDSGNYYIITTDSDNNYRLVSLSDSYSYSDVRDSALELVDLKLGNYEYKVHKSKNVTLTISYVNL